MLVIDRGCSPVPRMVILPLGRSQPKYLVNSIHRPGKNDVVGSPTLCASVRMDVFNLSMNAPRSSPSILHSAGTKSFTPAVCAAWMSFGCKGIPCAPVVEMRTSIPSRDLDASSALTSKGTMRTPWAASSLLASLSFDSYNRDVNDDKGCHTW
jgi:hypothetical protein